MLDFENKYYSKEINFICGCDEAGRGCLCGPVVAAAVVLPKNYSNPLINDSKQLTPKQREVLFLDIIKNALSYGIGYIDSVIIDKINIYEASRQAMIKAINNLNYKYDLILSDAMPINTLNKEVIPIIKGDAKCKCIAAASIIAKVCRDHYMLAMALKYPQYNLDKNKGYGTKTHLDALEKYGPIPKFHRFTYAPIKNRQLKLF